MMNANDMVMEGFRSAKMVKKSWSPNEDTQLLKLVEIHGSVNWVTIAEHLPTRSGKQCRERYHNHLRPNVKKGDWTDEEDKLIVDLHSKLGNAWAEITKALPGRTNNAVKNRWHTMHRPFIGQELSLSLSSSPASLQRSKVIIPKLVLPSLQQFATSTGCHNKYWEAEEHGHSHCCHTHEMTLSSRSDLSLPDAPSSSRRFESLSRSSAPSSKASPRIEIIAQASPQLQVDRMHFTKSDMTDAVASFDASLLADFDRFDLCSTVSNSIDLGSTISSFVDEEDEMTDKFSADPDLDHLYANSSATSSCFETDGSDDSDAFSCLSSGDEEEEGGLLYGDDESDEDLCFSIGEPWIFSGGVFPQPVDARISTGGASIDFEDDFDFSVCGLDLKISPRCTPRTPREPAQTKRVRL